MASVLVQVKGFFSPDGRSSLVVVKNISAGKLYAVHLEDNMGVLSTAPEGLYVLESLNEVGFLVATSQLTRRTYVALSDSGGHDDTADISWDQPPVAERRELSPSTLAQRIEAQE